jgi:hypothetical protein
LFVVPAMYMFLAGEHKVVAAPSSPVGDATPVTEI